MDLVLVRSFNCGTFMWNPAEPEQFCGTFAEPGTFTVWKLYVQPWGNLGKPGARFPAAAQTHQDVLPSE